MDINFSHCVFRFFSLGIGFLQFLFNFIAQIGGSLDGLHLIFQRLTSGLWHSYLLSPTPFSVLLGAIYNPILAPASAEPSSHYTHHSTLRSRRLLRTAGRGYCRHLVRSRSNSPLWILYLLIAVVLRSVFHFFILFVPVSYTHLTLPTKRIV